MSEETIKKPNREVKDTVFTALFKENKYLLELYQTLHPEDKEVDIDTISNITLKSILKTGPYNDLGFMVGDKLIVLIECQTTWTVNILVRELLYYAYTLQYYFQKTKQSLYNSKKVTFPPPEFYVVYVGDKGNKKDVLSMQDEFFDGKDVDIELKAKVIFEDGSNTIINQYINFALVYNEQVKKYVDDKHRAIEETIRICIENNYLKEFIENHKLEVKEMMDILYDEEREVELEKQQIYNDGVQIGEQRGMQRGMQQGMFNVIMALAKRGLPIDDLLAEFNLSRNDFDRML